LARREQRPPRRLSLDEAHHRRGRELATVVSDLDRRRVVEVLDGRSRRRVERFLRSLPHDERRAIEVVSIDPYRRLPPSDPRRTAARADRLRPLPPGPRRQHGAGLDPTRTPAPARPPATQGRAPLGPRRDLAAELYRARHRLLKASERLTERDRRRLCELFTEDPIIAEAWGLKEAFRAVYRTSSQPDAERRLDHFLAAVDRSRLPAFQAFADGVRQWRSELLAYFDEPTTNGYAEGVINKVKVIKRRAYGLPTFDGFRKRVVIACG
jgi:transposase